MAASLKPLRVSSLASVLLAGGALLLLGMRWGDPLSRALLLGVLFALWRLHRACRALAARNEELERLVGDHTTALSTRSDEARLSEARKAAILETALDCIVSMDEYARIVEFNPAAEQTFGYRRTEVLGRDFEQTIIPADFHPKLWEGMAHSSSTGTGHVQGTRIELMGRRADGSQFPMELSMTWVGTLGTLSFTAFMRDITERRGVERMKNEFVSTVSHELRTPLTSIRGSLGLLEGGVVGALPEPVLELVRIARSNTERLIRLVNDILDLEKMKAGKLELRVQRLEPGTLIDVTFAGLRSMADQAGVVLRGESQGAGSFQGDRDRLIQVLTNLVSNAIKFSPRGAEVEVLATASDDGRVRFTVADQGPGIPPEHLPRLFEKFQQLDSSDSRSKGGTGLGLAISKAIVEEHGGRIGVRSEPGQGTLFEVLLAPAPQETQGERRASP